MRAALGRGAASAAAGGRRKALGAAAGGLRGEPKALLGLGALELTRKREELNFN